MIVFNFVGLFFKAIAKTSSTNLTGCIFKPFLTFSGISTRSLRPLIRSGMQPNTAGQQNSGITNKKQYSYSYHELIKNRRK